MRPTRLFPLLLGLAAAARAQEAPRFTARAGATREAYSFAGPGGLLEASIQDRRFFGWNANAGAAYAHRFGLDDAELGVGAARPLRWGKSYAGFSLGAATRRVLLPTFRGALEGGVAVARGLSLEGALAYRRYDGAKLVGLIPTLTWERPHLRLLCGYSLWSSSYDSGAKSGGLSSYRLAAAIPSRGALEPWAAYARTKEAFQAGSSLAGNNFSADHASAGARLRLAGGVGLEASFSHERRRHRDQRVNRWSLGASYSWGAR